MYIRHDENICFLNKQRVMQVSLQKQMFFFSPKISKICLFGGKRDGKRWVWTVTVIWQINSSYTEAQAPSASIKWIEDKQQQSIKPKDCFHLKTFIIVGFWISDLSKLYSFFITYYDLKHFLYLNNWISGVSHNPDSIDSKTRSKQPKTSHNNLCRSDSSEVIHERRWSVTSASLNKLSPQKCVGFFQSSIWGRQKTEKFVHISTVCFRHLGFWLGTGPPRKSWLRLRHPWRLGPRPSCPNVRSEGRPGGTKKKGGKTVNLY